MTTPESFSLERLRELHEALGLFKSVIRSGEPWTPTCEEAYGRAVAASVALADRLQEADAVVNAARELFRKIDHEGYHCNAPVRELRDAVEHHASRTRESKA